MRQRFDSLPQSFLRHGGAVGINQAHGAESASKKIFGSVEQAFPKTIASLREKLESGGQQTIESGLIAERTKP